MSNTTKSERSAWMRIFNLIAFISVALIGVALLLGWALRNQSNGISGPFLQIAEIMAYLVVSFYSLFYAISRPRGKSLITHMIIWAASVVLIFVFVILNIL